MPAAAADVGQIRSGLQAVDETAGHRQDDVDQGGVEHLTALLGHQPVKARIFAVGQAAAVAEAVDDLLFDLGQQGDELCDAREVVGAGRAGQHRGPVFRQVVGALVGRVLDHLRGDQAAEPLAYVAFVEAGSVGDLGAGGRRQ